jgi:hypothetical protein
MRKGNATKRALDMFGSPHLSVGYLINRYKWNNTVFVKLRQNVDFEIGIPTIVGYP